MDSGIKTIADAKGKRVGWDTAQQSTLAQIKYTLEAWGLDTDKDIKKIMVSRTSEPVQALMEGRLDITIASVGMPLVKEASAKLGGLYWVPMVQSADDAKAKYILEKAPYLGVQFIKAGSEPDINNDTWVNAMALHLLTYQGFNSEAVYLITKAIWENEAELAPIHRSFKGWQKAMVYEKVVVPYHEGAIKFYKEVGAWTSKMDEAQRRLLSQK